VGYGSLLDPWQRPYVFGVIEHPGKGKKGTSCAACSGSCIGIGAARKDGRLVPLNSDFDLYSVGADGQAGTTLNNPKSFDDIVRANDGGYVGLGKDY
jgi:general secretion pathway protein G